MQHPIPVSVLFGDPDRVLPSVSPDAAHLAWLAPVEGALNLFIDSSPVTAESRGVRQYWWSHDSRHVLWLRDNGDENAHLISLDRVTGEVIDLTPFEGVRCEVIAIGRSTADVLVGLNRRDRRVFDLYRLDIASRTCVRLAQNPGVEDWLVGPDLDLVGAMRMREDGRVEVLAFDGDEWRVVNDDVGDYLAALPYGVTSSGELVLRTDKGRPTRYLGRLDLESGVLEEVFVDPRHDTPTCSSTLTRTSHKSSSSSRIGPGRWSSTRTSLTTGSISANCIVAVRSCCPATGATPPGSSGTCPTRGRSRTTGGSARRGTQVFCSTTGRRCTTTSGRPWNPSSSRHGVFRQSSTSTGGHGGATCGASTRRVPRAESDAFASALEARGVEHEYLVFDDEGHGIALAHNRETFYAHAEAFLRRHL